MKKSINKMAEEYLNKNARSIIEPMVTAVFVEKPKNPVIQLYIIL